MAGNRSALAGDRNFLVYGINRSALAGDRHVLVYGF